MDLLKLYLSRKLVHKELYQMKIHLICQKNIVSFEQSRDIHKDMYMQVLNLFLI
jgi:hypothetical protein